MQINCGAPLLGLLGVLTVHRLDVGMRIEGGEDADLVFALLAEPIPALLPVMLDVVYLANIVLCSTIDFHQVIRFEASGVADSEWCVFDLVQERPPETVLPLVCWRGVDTRNGERTDLNIRTR